MKGNNTDVEKIKYEWFGEEKMLNRKKKFNNLDLLIIFTNILSALFIIVGLIVLVIALDYVSQTKEITVTFGFSSFGLALFSIGIAVLSVSLALKSDKKMIANANESFLKIVDTFEDKRIQLLQHPDWLGIEGTIWKCQTYLDRAIKLKKSSRIENENQNMLFDQFDKLINRTSLPWNTDVIKPKDFGNIHEMEIKFLELDLTYESTEKLKRIKEYVKKFEKNNKKK